MVNGSEKYIEVIQWCGKLYDFLNEKFFKGELKKPVIIVSPDNKAKFLGWFVRAECWKENSEDKGETEINISANFLNRPAIEIAETMLHEMCHHFAYVNEIKDCSRTGTYHNKLYARIAENHGLTVKKVPTSGYASTALTNESKKIIQTFVKDEKFIYRILTFKGAKINNSSTRKYVCPNCSISVRATKTVNIMCVDCNEFMQEEES